MVEPRVDGSRCATRAIRVVAALVFGGEPCQVSPWWNEPPPARTTTGTSSGSAPSGAAPRTGASQSSGAWNCERCGALRGQRWEPRTYSIGPGVGRQVVERHPAGDHLGRHRGSRRTTSPGGSRSPSRRGASRARCPAGAGRRASPRARAARAPTRFESTCAATTVSAFQPLQICRVRSSGSRPGHPVHLVRLDPGLVVAVEQGEEALAQKRQGGCRDEAVLDDDEAVAVERGDLLGLVTTAAVASPGRRRGSGRRSPECASGSRRACRPRPRFPVPRSGRSSGRARRSSSGRASACRS